MRESMLSVSCVLPVAAVYAFLVFFTSCGNSDSASGVRPNDSAENVSSSEFLNIESSSSDLELPSSGSWFGGSSALDSSEGSSLGLESMTLPVSSSVRQHRVQSSSSANVHSVSLDQDGFATVADVYKSLLPEEKAVFIIRHSEREDAVAMETELTANGVKMAQDLGKSIKSDEELSYITSGFVRTNETANNVSIGRGEPTLPKLITNYDITGNWFLKISADSLAKHADALGLKGSSVELMARWAYEGGYSEVFYELEPRTEEFIQTIILKNLPKWKRVSVMVSHDILVMPLTVFGSQRKVALKYHEDYHWINYIAGLAVIVGAGDSIRYIPIKGSDSGVIDYLAIYKRRLY
ncbi:MAG: histidine phosphatase family protein [Fibrobacter sp.]|nr:histidine phosphatase family protein [Fibrobacter sp.]